MFNFKSGAYRVIVPELFPDECVAMKLNSENSKPARGLRRGEIALAVLSALERGWSVVSTRDINIPGTFEFLVASPEVVQKEIKKHTATLPR